MTAAVDPGVVEDPTAKRVFELFVDTLVVERDTADYALRVRVKWYGEDVVATEQRLQDDPRSARALISHLAEVVHELEVSASMADTMEENVHQARRWALILPQIQLDEPVVEPNLAPPPNERTGER